MARNRVGVRTRRRILEATRTLLAEQGGEETVTLKAITDRAGVGAGSFYNLFETKEEAVFEVVKEAIAAVDPDPSGATETIEDLVGAFVSFFERNPVLARIYLKLAVAGGLTNRGLGDRVLRSHEARTRRFADAFERAGLSEGEASRSAERLLAALTGLAIHAQLQHGFDFHAHAEVLARTALSVDLARSD